jgi:hypothetical protein
MSEKPRPWTPTEKDFVSKNFMAMTDGAIAMALGRSIAGVQRIRTENALLRSTDRKQKRWSKEEADFVYQNYKAMSDTEMARHLGRKIDSIQLFRSTRKLYKTKLNRLETNPLDHPQQNPNCPLVLFQINKQLIADWYREHGEKSYGDTPVNFRNILTSYQKAAA